MDEKTIGMTRTTIHITRKTNCAVIDIDHAMIHTDRCRDPYGKRQRKTPKRRSDSVRDRTEIRGWKSALSSGLGVNVRFPTAPFSAPGEKQWGRI
jgi:hypothetical protein